MAAFTLANPDCAGGACVDAGTGYPPWPPIGGRTFDRMLWDDTTTGVAPTCQQPNGMYFYSVGFHGGDYNT
eukprot:gene3611-2286_t